jgi:hypothetical protein
MKANYPNKAPLISIKASAAKICKELVRRGLCEVLVFAYTVLLRERRVRGWPDGDAR